MNTEEILGEINACKQLLADSDYTIIKTIEGLLSCTSAIDMIAYLKGIADDVMALKDKRQAWRDTINRLEEQLEQEGTDKWTKS